MQLKSPDGPQNTTASLPPKTAMGSRDLWGFLAFSHGWTWLCWGVVVASGAHVWGEPWATAVFAIGGLGLPIGGVVMTWSVAGRDGLRGLGRRLVDPTRIAPRWWLVILGLYPAIKLVAGGCAVLFGSVDVPFELAETSALLRAPGELLAVMGFLLLLGPLPEEIGWRGFLLDRLQVRYRALPASLLLGLAWFAWHGPLFFITGYYDRAGGAPELLPFGAAIVLAAVLYTWIYNHTGRSVLAAVLFHFSGNLTGELLDAPAVVYRYELLLTAVVVLVVVWWWGGKTLSASVRDSTNAAPAEPPSIR
jgi:membrane protease YdiL (CAAX protease family)